MFKMFSNMMKVEKAPLTPEEIAFIETPANTGYDWSLEDHKNALSGSRAACYKLATLYTLFDPERAYFWATVALLARHLGASGAMDRLNSQVPLNDRYFLEITARKWHALHKKDFVQKKADRANAVRQIRAMGLSGGGDPNDW